MKTGICTLIMLALLLPALPDTTEAQRRTNFNRTNPFSFSPYVGMYKDAYDAAADGSDLGWLLGFKAGYHMSDRAGLHLNFGYAQANDVATRPTIGDGVIIDNQWVIMTVGGEFALVPGNTSVALGTDVGVAWRHTDADESEGTILDGEGGWGSYEVVAPALTLRHQFSARTGVFASVHDYITDVFEGPVQHSPALTFGLTFR